MWLFQNYFFLIPWILRKFRKTYLTISLVLILTLNLCPWISGFRIYKLPFEYANFDALLDKLELNNLDTMIRLDNLHAKRKWMILIRICVNIDVHLTGGRKIIIHVENMCEKNGSMTFL
ncbi:hypothetical protein V2J09_016407 [Rumex salicifolius]